VSSKVNQNLLGEESTPLTRAGDAQDRFVETLGDKVMRQMAKILESGEDEVARVSAGKAILEWIRPRKNGPMIAINNSPAFVSHLGLPMQVAPPSVTQEQEKLPAPIEVEKVLPEAPSPLSAAKLRSLKEIEIKPAPSAPTLPDRSPSMRAPDMPDPAGKIRKFN
jgi:hypothetical protein